MDTSKLSNRQVSKYYFVYMHGINKYTVYSASNYKTINQFEHNNPEQHGCIYIYNIYIPVKYKNIPVVPHKAVAEVSNIGHDRRDWLLWVTDGRAKTLMDWTVQVSRWLIAQLTNWLID